MPTIPGLMSSIGMKLVVAGTREPSGERGQGDGDEKNPDLHGMQSFIA